MSTPDLSVDARRLIGFHSPALLLDPATLPPPILTSEPDSFAQDTLRRRIPVILQETIDLNPDFDLSVRRGLDELGSELNSGRIRELREDAPDVALWNEVSAPHLGRSWLDVPWYWAEAYFYRRLLEATGYFREGRWRGFDPFGAKKRTEWAADGAPAALEALLASLPDDPAARFEQLFHASLWGNRTDLSYMVAAHLGGTANSHAERENLLADDTAATWEWLRAMRPSRIAIMADNTGTELLMDLALIDYLLEVGLASAVHLYLKPQPFFVSDAMVWDAQKTLDFLTASDIPSVSQLGQALSSARAHGRLELRDHPFFTGPGFYTRLPADLGERLGRASLVIAKGDVNYRRFLEDRHWPYETPLKTVIPHFPANALLLRTFKGELVAGLSRAAVGRLEASGTQWLIDGAHGVAQFLEA
jgi:uncharacterized protein with ATP-grasp and redox domains